MAPFQGPIKTVVFFFAMEAEATPFIQALGLIKDEPSKLPGPIPAVSFSGDYEGLKVHVVWNGKDPLFGVDNVGTVPASLTSYLAIQALHPDIVISAGTAGGFKSKTAAIGDVFLGTHVVNHDRRIPIPGFDAYGIGRQLCLPTPQLRAALGLKEGVISSGNSLDYTDSCLKIMEAEGVAIKEMESAAIAWSCRLFVDASGTTPLPLICIKAVTDIVDGGRPTHEEFLENLSTAAKSLQTTLPLVLKFIVGKALTEL
uniref:Nucleoside phosphorylase domain-containing protein n=1 Tax=Polytomella parva TaxID=51329 RepID=A0A7S0Y7R1_9CHLO